LGIYLTLKPILAEVYYHLGLVYKSQGKRNEAVQALKKALEINPKYADARQKLDKVEER
jgi:tetratricopeptide (TPR) repeat protein